MNSPSRLLEAGFLGRVDYESGLSLQREAADRLASASFPGEKNDSLLLLEHPPVFTLGKNASESEIVVPRALVEARGASVVRCDRGGKITYHGPGQLVGYPILDLRPDRCDVGSYVAGLEEVLIRVLGSWGIAAGRFPGYTGVWVDVGRPGELPEFLAGDGRARTREGRSAARSVPPPSVRKIAAIGIHLARWITTHGFAFNVQPDLSFYDLIVPCGIREFGVTSMKEVLGVETPLGEVAERLVPIFGEVFGRTVVPHPAPAPGPSERG
jgi:lipoyl(octanoyl) transferase